MKFWVAAALVASAVSGHQASAYQLIQNGDFEATGGVGGYGQVIPSNGTNKTPAYSVNLPDWTSPVTSTNAGAPFVFVANPATLDTTGFPDSWDNGFRTLWGTNNGGNYAITAPPDAATSVLSMDGAYNSSPIYQVLSGLVVGDQYSLTLDWAATQWHENNGPTTDSVTVVLGNQAFTTPVYSLPSEGFSGWMVMTDTFTYSGGTDTVAYGGAGGQTYTTLANTLTILTTGAPTGVPPGVLISGVSLIGPDTPSSVPEPASWAMMLFGVAAVGVAALRRRRAAAAAANVA
jgi:hypothetical protein